MKHFVFQSRFDINGMAVDNVTFEQAAMLEPMAVAAHAIRRTTISPADKVVVCGLGTIGMFITMLLAEMKLSNTYVIGNKDFQKNKIIEMGIPAENYCDSRTEEVDSWIQTKTGSGADVYFEFVGKNETVSCSVDNTIPGGSIVLVGNPYSDISLDKKVYWKILRNQLRVTGT